MTHRCTSNLCRVVVFSGVQDVMMDRSEMLARSGRLNPFLVCHMKRNGGK